MSNPDHSIIDISVTCTVFGFDGQALNVLLMRQRPPVPDFPLKETLDDAAARVLYECTELDGIFLQQFYTFGHPQRVRAPKDQDWLKTVRAHPERRVVTVAYYSLVKMDDVSPRAAPDSLAQTVEWVDIAKIPALAFDHNKIVVGGLKRLKEQLTSENLGFKLLPEKFTLIQLQHLYEIVLERKLDKRNFRKTVKKMQHLIPLDEKEDGVVRKPAQLFKYKRDFPE
jgi:8-oxo-dGTP diphosphatase